MALRFSHRDLGNTCIPRLRLLLLRKYFLLLKLLVYGGGRSEALAWVNIVGLLYSDSFVLLVYFHLWP